MKVTAFLVLLTLCGIAAANLLTQLQRGRRQNTNCFDEACQNFTNSLPQLCDTDDDNVACGDECTGAKCQFYTDNNYSVDCIDLFASSCSFIAGSVPDACVVQPGRQCLDGPYWNFRTTLPENCNITTDITLACSEECAGRACSYYNNNGYPDECSMEVAIGCNATDGTIPPTCSGALGQEMVKGMLPVILLIAAILCF